MITPDALLKLNAANLGRDRAPVGAIEPTVWPQRQVVGKRMAICHPEARKQHFRIAAGNIIAILVWIEQQVRRLSDKDAPVTEAHPGGEIQAGHKIARSPILAILVRIAQNRNAI